MLGLAVFLLTLLFWSFVPVPLADKVVDSQPLQNTVHIADTVKPLPDNVSLYQGIQVTKENLKQVLAYEFGTYGLESQIQTAEAVVACESGFQVDPPHNGVSWGIAQFTKPTWKDFGYGDIMNPLSQVQVMAKMFSRGLQNRWDCFRTGAYKKYL